MIVIACVCKTGGFKTKHSEVEYFAQNVLWLKQMVEKNVTIPHKFVCLTDLEHIKGVKTIKLKHNWVGWWSKIELFRPDLFQGKKVFYIDLDTVIIKNIDNILKYPHVFTVLQDVLSSTQCDKIGSGLMAWNMDLSKIYTKFLKNPEEYMKQGESSSCWGDQGYIAKYVKGMQKFQDIFPNEIVSIKRLVNSNVQKKNKIVVFHGNVKPYGYKAEWLPEFDSE